MPRKSILYFDKPGEANTEETLQIAKERATELGIRDIIVASTRGRTGVKTVEMFQGYNVVVVPTVTGLGESGVQGLSAEMAEKIKATGGKIQIAAHAFSGVSSAILRTFDMACPPTLIAQTLRLFGQGMKVCVEIAAMAADAGLIPVNQDVVAIAGTRGGADTAIVIKPASSRNLFDMVVREIIAKPQNI